MKPMLNLLLLGAAIFVAGCDAPDVSNVTTPARPAHPPTVKSSQTMSNQITKTDAEWRKELTPDQYAVLRQKGTERAFTGKYWDTKDKGVYRCAGCGEVLFQSDSKFDSGCGWPSFSAAGGTNAITEAKDDSFFMARTEVVCTKCGGHLGHLFDDGPAPSGLRYCINSASLKFEATPDEKAKPAPK